jgi:hypothetical protein
MVANQTMAVLKLPLFCGNFHLLVAYVNIV